MKTYTVVARRSGDWWALQVPHVRAAHSQCRRLSHALTTARDLVSGLLDVPMDSFDLRLQVQLDDDLALAREQAIDAAREAREATERAGIAMRSAATLLVERERMTVRDVGQLLGVSPQRVSQLTCRT